MWGFSYKVLKKNYFTSYSDFTCLLENLNPTNVWFDVLYSNKDKCFYLCYWFSGKTQMFFKMRKGAFVKAYMSYSCNVQFRHVRYICTHTLYSRSIGLLNFQKIMDLIHED